MQAVRCSAKTKTTGRMCRRTVTISEDADGSCATCFQHSPISASIKDHFAKEKEALGSCPICFDDITSLRSCVKLDCNGGVPHAFHNACLQSWIEKGNATCPMCRDEVPPKVVKKVAPVYADRLEAAEVARYMARIRDHLYSRRQVV